MGSPRQHAMERNQDQRNGFNQDQRDKVNQSAYNKNKKAIKIFENKLRSDVNAQFKMRGLDPKSNDPAVRKILESIVGRAKSKNDKYMRSLGIRTNMPRPKQRPTGTPVPKRRPLPQGMSLPKNASPEAVAKARAAYVEMMKRRAEKLKKSKQRPTGTPVPQAKESPASIMARRKRQAEARARFIANRQRNSKDAEIRMKQLAIDTGRTKGTKSVIGDKSLDIEKRMKQLAIERRRAKAKKELKRQYEARKVKLPKQKTKLTTATQKGIPPSAIKQMQDANKKMQARVFGGSKKPTTKRTFART
jgi:hypothetical protein